MKLSGGRRDVTLITRSFWFRRWSKLFSLPVVITLDYKENWKCRDSRTVKAFKFVFLGYLIRRQKGVCAADLIWICCIITRIVGNRDLEWWAQNYIALRYDKYILRVAMWQNEFTKTKWKVERDLLHFWKSKLSTYIWGTTVRKCRNAVMWRGLKRRARYYHVV